MKRLGGLLMCAFISMTNAANGQEIIGKLKESEGLKTTYSINNEQTVVTTLAKDVGSKYDKQLDTYLFPSFKKALQEMAFVSSITQTKGEESSETNSWSDYETKKRKSHAFINLSLQSPLTLLFEIEETYRTCKTTKPVSSDRDGGYESGSSSSSTCSKQVELTVRGPISVYGNYANSINVDALLRNKQEVNLTLNKSYDNKDTNLISRFQIKSITFDEGLARFFRIFNLPVFVGNEGDVGYGNSLLDKVSPLTSRQRLMLGISRVARTANERMMN